MNLTFLKGKFARKLIFALIIFSSIITLVTTGIQISWDYRGELNNIQSSLADIESSNLASLSQALWVLDNLQIQSQLKGLLEKRDISYLAIIVDDLIKWQVGKKTGSNEITKEFPIFYKHRGVLRNIGKLRVKADLTLVYKRLLEKVLVILFSNFIKTFLVAGFLYIVIHRLLTRHLIGLSIFANALGSNLDVPPLQLERTRTGKRNDELEDVVEALNKMQSDLKTSYGELEENEAYKNLLLDSSYVSIVGVDEDGKINFANQSCLSLLGFESEKEILHSELHGLVHHQHLGEPEQDLPQCPIQLYLKTDKPIRIQNDAFHRSDGNKFDVEYWIYPIHREGVKKGAVISFLDMSQQRETERLKDDFISTISHELRTPLTSIMGSLGILNGMYSNELTPDMKDILDISQRNADQLIHLINDLLDIQKMESGNFNLQLKEIRLPSLLEYAVKINQGYAEKFNVNLQWEDQKIEATVNGDWDRLIQVMSNLISNAIKFSPDQGQVIVSLENIANKARIIVADKGVGIPEEFKNKIFQKFTQLESHEDRNYDGSGLGLNISKRIVESHGGTIGFNSKLNEGSEFYFDLPLIQTDLTKAS